MFYFHFENGTTNLDHSGLDLVDMTAARAEAVATVAGILRGGDVGHLWLGKPWLLWATDEPNGAGRTLLSIHITGSSIVLPLQNETHMPDSRMRLRVVR
jgi:hypothetical protein